jgi:hypothetical protein
MEEQRGDELHKFRLETDQTNHPYPIHGWHRPCMRTVTAQWPHMGGWKLLQACPSCVSLVLSDLTTGVKCSCNKGVFTGVATELMMSRVVTLPAWSLKRILVLVVQFFSLLIFSFRYCVLVQGSYQYHYCFSVQVQETNKGTLLSSVGVCSTTLLLSWFINVWKDPNDVSIVGIVLKGDKSTSQHVF